VGALRVRARNLSGNRFGERPTRKIFLFWRKSRCVLMRKNVQRVSYASPRHALPIDMMKDDRLGWRGLDDSQLYDAEFGERA